MTRLLQEYSNKRMSEKDKRKPEKKIDKVAYLKNWDRMVKSDFCFCKASLTSETFSICNVKSI